MKLGGQRDRWSLTILFNERKSKRLLLLPHLGAKMLILIV